MSAVAVFPVNEGSQNDDGTFDFRGAVWNWYDIGAFPCDGVVTMAVLVKRTPEARVARHSLKVYTGDGSDDPIFEESLPGLPSDSVNGAMVIGVPMHLDGLGWVTIGIQIDESPMVTTQFEMRLRNPQFFSTASRRPIVLVIRPAALAASLTSG